MTVWISMSTPTKKLATSIISRFLPVGRPQKHGSRIILIAFWVGMTFDRHPSDCLTNCPTDISSSRR
jgi:hypothetical protein